MAKTKCANWPVLLTDGGWREQRVEGQYFNSYYRLKRSRIQRITFNEAFGPSGRSAWVLESGSNFAAAGSLDHVLYAAESCK